MDALGIIFAYSEYGNLREICEERTIASVLFGGKYRLVDFAMSNFVNSEVLNMVLITKDKYNSLIDHVGLGKEWDLDRKRGGIRILTPLGNENTGGGGTYRGKTDALACHMRNIKRAIAEYVIISPSFIIYNIDFNELMDFHKYVNADISMVYTKITDEVQYQKLPLGAPLCIFDENNRLVDVYVKTEEHNNMPANCGMGIFLMKKSLLEALVADAMSFGRYDFYMGLLKKQAQSLRIMGYEYKKHYICIHSVTEYLQGNLSLLDPKIREQVFEKIVYTKVKDSVPVQYGAEAKVKNSIVADGCIIEGTVENSIISRGVRIGKGAVVKNSVIMEYTNVYQNAKLEYVIVDKDVIVRDGSEISGHITFPVVIKKRSIV